MKKISLILLAAVLLCGLTACKSKKVAEVQKPDTGMIAVSFPKLAKEWKLVELMGEPISAESAAQTPVITLTRDGKVSGNLGCNSIAGTYTWQDDIRIKFSNLVTTQKMCLKMDVETKLLQVLNTADSYIISDNRLILNRARMAPLAVFE
jgi:heat shock protein HslJ